MNPSGLGNLEAGGADHPTVVAPWWKSAVVYQIYPRSYADSDGDGVGDLEGIRARLDHLRWLGVDALWISPFYRSPMADFGYDVADYCDVDPLFGTLGDFDRLVADAHQRGLRVLIDWVPNHTSDQHPWFVESRSSRHNPKRDWYLWCDGSPDRPPNNWVAAFGGPAWTWDATTTSWYLHLFLPEQPDLNWRNPEVVAAMHATLRFWLDRGVDGFRVDVVHGLVKDPAYPDTPRELIGTPQSGLNDHPGTHALLKDLRRLLDSYPGDRVMVGEVYLLSSRQVAPYYGRGDQLHLSFNFAPLHEPWDPARWRASIDDVAEHLDPVGAWPTWVLSNHDHPRHRSRYGGSSLRARAAAVLLLTLRGTPFVYQGEELGLLDADVPPGRRVDPGGRDGCRAPVPWDASERHGWAGDPWLPWPPHADADNVEVQRADQESILHLYRRVIATRRASPALSLGSLSLLEGPDDVVAYERRLEADRRVVVVNFGPAPAAVAVPGPWVVETSSTGGGEGTGYGGTVPPETAVILRRAQPP